MLVRMKSGCIEELHDFVGERFIAEGRADRLSPQNEELILKAEELGGPTASAGIEVAMLEQKTERARIKFVRTPRSRG